MLAVQNNSLQSQDLCFVSGQQPQSDVMNGVGWDGFLFYPTFRLTYEWLKRAGQSEVATRYIEMVMAYGTENQIPQLGSGSDDAILNAVLPPVFRAIDSKKRDWVKKQEAKKKRKLQAEQKAKEKHEL